MSENKSNAFASIWPLDIKEQVDFVVKRFGYENHGQVARKIRLLRKKYGEPMTEDEINTAIAYMKSAHFLKVLEHSRGSTRKNTHSGSRRSSRGSRSGSRNRKASCPEEVLERRIPYISKPKGVETHTSISVRDALEGCRQQGDKKHKMWHDDDPGGKRKGEECRQSTKFGHKVPKNCSTLPSYSVRNPNTECRFSILKRKALEILQKECPDYFE